MGRTKAVKPRDRKMAVAIRPVAIAPALPPLSRRTRWAVAVIVAAALALRLAGIKTIPIAGDESVYLRWAEIIVHQGQWFISLLDGKQPLSYWLYAVARAAWPGDPLTAARLVSVAAGTLSTLGIFLIGRRVAGEMAGIIAAALYAVLPYALLYDRLAYTDSLINLAGVAIVLLSLDCFEVRGFSWRRAGALGLVLGLGYFTKSTALLFWFFPALAAVWRWRSRRGELARALGLAYGIALVFPLIGYLAVPHAPMMETHSLVLHQTKFFVPPEELLRHPLAVAPGNIRLLGKYLRAYVTLPLLGATAAAIVYLGARRAAAPLIVFTTCWAPLALQVFVLQLMFPTRYPFPHVWPALVAIGAAVAALPLPGTGARRAALAAVVTAAIGGMAAGKGVGVARNPQECLYVEDSRTFVGSGPAAGYGIPEAVDYLKREAASGPLVVLTDPIWGPPADAIFVYLNERAGIRVYEAWWTTLSGKYPILPPAPVEVLKSQYERVAAGVLNPATLGRVYYVTERQYNSPEAVERRQPGARAAASFLKPNGRNAIDVYRLR